MGWRHAAAILLLAAIVAWLYADLATPQVILTHEFDWPYLRLVEYQLEMSVHVPPQVFPDAVGGGGFAFPRYYPPLPYWISVVTAWIAGDPVTGIHLSFGLSVLLSVAAFYWMAVRMTGSASLALLGAVLYGTATYRFVEIFVRGALAESWTFPWLPLVALGTWEAARRSRVSWMLPLSIGALLLTHTVMALYAVSAAGLAIVIASIRARRLAPFAVFVASVTLGGGLAVWHLLPAITSLDAVWAGSEDFMGASRGHVLEHAVTFRQLFVDDPEHWRGLSMPGDVDDMSFALGLGDLLVLPLALAAGALAMRPRRKPKGESRPSGLGLGLLAGLTLLWVGCVAFVVMPGPALTVLPPQFLYVQFPWRLLGFTTFLGAAACVVALHRIASASAPGARRWIEIAAVLGALIAVGTVPEHHRRARLIPTTADTLHEQRIPQRSFFGYTVLGEYLPREVEPRNAVALVLQAAEAAPQTPGVDRIERNGSTTRVRVSAREAFDLVLPVVYYDFYAARTDDGRVLETGSADGLLRLSLPPGEYSLEVAPRLSVTSRIGLGVALLAALLITALALRGPARTRPV